MKNKLIYVLLIPAIFLSMYVCLNLYAQAPAQPPIPKQAVQVAPTQSSEQPSASVAPRRPTEQQLQPPALPPTTAVNTSDEPEQTQKVKNNSDEEITFIRPDGKKQEQITTDTNNLISITLDNVPLAEVVRMFALVSGANIVANADTLTGTVTVNLKDVEWKPALNSILDMHGFTLVEKDLNSGVYSIVQRPLDAPVPMLTKSFKLKFATVADISPIIRSMIPEGATLNEFGSRNMLVVRSTAESLSDIDQIIKEIDKPKKQVCVETKFMELSDAAMKELGIRWDALQEFGVNLQAGPFAYTRNTQNVFERVDASSKSATKYQSDSSTKSYDIYGVQQPDPASRVVSDNIGTPIALAKDAQGTTIDFGNKVDRGDLLGNTETHSQNIVKGFSERIETTQAAILTMDQFKIVLSALQNTAGASLISNPKLIVANGATNALFSVGDREPIIKTEIQRGTTESPGDIITASLDTGINTDYIKQGYLSTGIDLRVIPVVKTDNLIEAEIIPSLRRKTGDKTIGENSWPEISVKEIRTKFTLVSGQTVAIGGLTDTKDAINKTKIPFLGDIPLLGKYLFSHSQKVKSQVETIIFVTLSLANPETINNNIGIPEYGQLVQRQLIRDKLSHSEYKEETQKIQEAADLKQMDRAREMRANLLKRK